MFLLGMGKDEMEKALELNDKSIISKHLYIVWSISESDFWFRHHLETNVDNQKILKDIAYKEYSNLDFANYIVKVRVNHIGVIVGVGEY